MTIHAAPRLRDLRDMRLEGNRALDEVTWLLDDAEAGVLPAAFKIGHLRRLLRQLRDDLGDLATEVERLREGE